MRKFGLTPRMLSTLVALGMIVSTSLPAWAVVADSFYTTDIQVQGEVAGTEFDDWAASGIPVTVSDPLDNPGEFFIDIADIQIANDSDYLYLRVTTHSLTTQPLSGLLLGFDMDQDGTSGFDMQAEVGLADPFGSEIGFSTDYPFEQRNDFYWDFAQGFTEFGGDYIGVAPIFPFYDIVAPEGTQMEWAIPLTIALGPTAPGTPVFDGDSFDLVVYTFGGAGDVAEVITYTLAEAPALAGDFDADGDVDGADFLEWQRDADALGAAGLADWTGAYSSPSASLAISAVPEPTSCVLAMLGLIALSVRRQND